MKTKIKGIQVSAEKIQTIFYPPRMIAYIEGFEEMTVDFCDGGNIILTKDDILLLVNNKINKKESKPKVKPEIKVDVFEVRRMFGPTALVADLSKLTHAELKNIIRAQGFDMIGKCFGWVDSDKNKTRLIDFIIKRTEARATKGDVFMSIKKED